MVKIVVIADIDPDEIIGVKEQLAMLLEQYGDLKVSEITEIQPEQMAIKERNKYHG